MNKKLHRVILLLIASTALPVVSSAKDASGEWMGQLSGPFDSQYTAQYNHVVLNVAGVKLSGAWGPYTVTGTLMGSKLNISLTDVGGKPAGTLSGAMEEDAFSGTGSVVLARRGGGGAAPSPTEVRWNLTRAATPPAMPKT